MKELQRPKTRRDEDNFTNAFNRNVVFEGDITPERALSTTHIEFVFLENAIPFELGKCIQDFRDRVLMLCKKIDQGLHDHLVDVGAMTNTLLDDQEFKSAFKKLAPLLYPHQDRQEEVDALFQEEQKERIALGLQLHDLGKIHPKVSEAINSTSPLTDHQVQLIKRHPAVKNTLDFLGIDDPIIRQIVLFHHAPKYWGALPDRSEGLEALEGRDRQEAFQLLPLHVVIAICLDIFSAMTEERPYRKNRYVLWWRETKEHIEARFPSTEKEEDIHLRHFSIQDELERCIPLPNGHELVELFLETMRRNVEKISKKRTAKENLNLPERELPLDFPHTRVKKTR